jgi:hypothetical protein
MRISRMRWYPEALLDIILFRSWQTFFTKSGGGNKIPTKQNSMMSGKDTRPTKREM